MSLPRIVLIGPPGSGKSAVASALGRIWDLEVRDTDKDIVLTEGRDIASIFLESGEAEFRQLERNAVSKALSETNGIVALGGGAILDPDTQADLVRYAKKGGTVVFLDVTPAVAARRVKFNTSRPLLLGNPRRKWAELMDARRPIYERLATFTVLTDSGTATRTAHQIVEAEERG